MKKLRFFHINVKGQKSDKGKRFEFDKVSRFVYDIERVYRFCCVSRDDYPLSEERVREIQSSVLASFFSCKDSIYDSR